MNPAVAEWVAKAEGDFLTAGRELRARKAPNYDAVCFDTQVILLKRQMLNPLMPRLGQQESLSGRN